MTGNQIAVVAAPAFALVLGTSFVRAYRRNQRMADREFGGLTRTETSLNRVHAIAIMGVLLVGMGLAFGAATSTTVRDALADAGEHNGWIRLAAIPVVLVYGRWLSRAVARASRERRAMTAPPATAGITPTGTVPCQVVIEQFRPLGMADPTGPLYAFDLTVIPEHGAPWSTSACLPVPTEALAHMHPGARLAATVTARDPHGVVIDWTSAPVPVG